MNYKTKMMVKHKKLYGGDYYKESGRWYWKKNPEDVGVMVTSGWVIDRVNNYKPEQPVPVEEPKIETPITQPKTPVKKSSPKKKKETVNTETPQE